MLKAYLLVQIVQMINVCGLLSFLLYADIGEEEIHPERNSESQKLMNHNSTEKMASVKLPAKGRRPPNRST